MSPGSLSRNRPPSLVDQGHPRLLREGPKKAGESWRICLLQEGPKRRVNSVVCRRTRPVTEGQRPMYPCRTRTLGWPLDTATTEPPL